MGLPLIKNDNNFGEGSTFSNPQDQGSVAIYLVDGSIQISEIIGKKRTVIPTVGSKEIIAKRHKVIVTGQTPACWIIL